MSGGSFNYAYSCVNEFVDKMKDRLDNVEETNEYGEQPNKFSPEVIDMLREIELTVRHTAKLMKEVEWLYSGDSGEKTFVTNVYATAFEDYVSSYD